MSPTTNVKSEVFFSIIARIDSHRDLQLASEFRMWLSRGLLISHTVKMPTDLLIFLVYAILVMQELISYAESEFQIQ